MYLLYYLRWIGTTEEMKEYVGRVSEICNQTEDVTFKGVFSPTIEWSFVILFEGTSYDKVLGVYKTYIMKYDPHPKIPLAKVEALHTFEELGLQM